MCGILGLAGPGVEANAVAFGEALDLLAHRGPDDRGILREDSVLLGHRRLSIIDLSSAGHQPMVDPTTGAAIIFNGEIYNYPELRGELENLGQQFQGRSDTEVLLHAYLRWGSGCLNRLNGMWAFAIWLPASRRIFLARDRFGVKPLYYRHDRGLCFASEPKAILHLHPECRKVDGRTLAEFLAWGRLHASDRAFYDGIQALPAAHYAEYDVDEGSLRLSRYWNYPETAAPDETPRQALEQFGALLDDAVRVRLRSDVPVGITLSGGLDSTAVLAASLKGSHGARPCFTAVFPGQVGELPWARKAASPYGIEPIEVLAPQERWLDLMSRISWHMDAPGYSPAVFPLWAIMEEARRRGVPVLLEGQGADELLAGYPQYMALALLGSLRHASTGMSGAAWSELRNMWQSASRTFSSQRLVLWMARELAPRLAGPYRRQVGAGETLRAPYRLPLEGPGRGDRRYADRVNERLWRDHAAEVLPGLLHYGDAISMAHSIESRLPFMDYRLVEWAFSRPSRLKTGAGRSKFILREYLSAAGQAAIAERADKQGFPTPVEQWLAADGGSIARKYLLGADARILEFCEPDKVRRLVERHAGGTGGAGNPVYRLLSTELWMRRCLA